MTLGKKAGEGRRPPQSPVPCDRGARGPGSAGGLPRTLLSVVIRVLRLCPFSGGGTPPEGLSPHSPPRPPESLPHTHSQESRDEPGLKPVFLKNPIVLTGWSSWVSQAEKISGSHLFVPTPLQGAPCGLG